MKFIGIVLVFITNYSFSQEVILRLAPTLPNNGTKYLRSEKAGRIKIERADNVIRTRHLSNNLQLIITTDGNFRVENVQEVIFPQKLQKQYPLYRQLKKNKIHYSFNKTILEFLTKEPLLLGDSLKRLITVDREQKIIVMTSLKNDIIIGHTRGIKKDSIQINLKQQTVSSLFIYPNKYFAIGLQAGFTASWWGGHGSIDARIRFWYQ